MSLRTDTQPWYRQFWPWFVIALPLAMVIISLSLFAIALKMPFSMVNKDYYQDGLTINKNLKELKQATALGIQAVLSFSDDRRIHVALTANTPLKTSALQLQFDHPIDDGKDIHLTLDRVDDNLYLSHTLSAVEWQNLRREKHWYLYLHADNNQRIEWMLESESTSPITSALTLGSRGS